MRCFLESALSDLLDRALHIEITFRHVIVFAVQNFLESTNCVGNRYLFAFTTSEDLRHTKRLTEKTLNFARSKYRHLILRREFVHSENGNNILQIFVTLQYFLDTTGNFVVLLAHNIGCQCTRSGGERIYSGIDPKLRNGTLEHDGGVEVCKRGRRCRIRQVISRYVHRLKRSDRTFGGRCDAPLKGPHLGG